MAEAAQYGQFALHLANKLIDWTNDSIYVALVGATGTPNQDSHDFYNDVTDEIAATGYTANGAALSGKSASYDSGTNQTRLIASDTTWSSVDFTSDPPEFAIVYDRTPASDATRPLISYVDFLSPQSVGPGVNFTIDWDATGVARFDAAAQA